MLNLGKAVTNFRERCSRTGSMDEKSIKQIVREELKKLSGLTWGQRLGYIWDYYKPLMVAILVIIAVISIGVSAYRNLQINHIFQAYLINCNSYETDADQIIAEFAEYIGGIGKDDEITIDTSMTYDPDDATEYGMASQMKLVTLGAAGEIDVLIGDEPLLDHYMESGGLQDLTDILSEEQLAAWEDDLVEGTDPEEGTTGIYALKLTESPVLARYAAYPEGSDCYAMLFVSGKHTELSVRFLEYLMGE